MPCSAVDRVVQGPRYVTSIKLSSIMQFKLLLLFYEHNWRIVGIIIKE